MKFCGAFLYVLLKYNKRQGLKKYIQLYVNTIFLKLYSKITWHHKSMKIYVNKKLVSFE